MEGLTIGGEIEDFSQDSLYSHLPTPLSLCLLSAFFTFSPFSLPTARTVRIFLKILCKGFFSRFSVLQSTQRGMEVRERRERKEGGGKRTREEGKETRG